MGRRGFAIVELSLIVFVLVAIGTAIFLWWPGALIKLKSCASLDLPGYSLASVDSYPNTVGTTVPAELVLDMNQDGGAELIRFYSEISADYRTKPIMLRVFSGDVGCYQGEFMYTADWSNELGLVQIMTDFWGEGDKVVVFELINTGYGSGFTSHLDFLAYQNGSYKIVDGPALDELSDHKFVGSDKPGEQIVVAKPATGLMDDDEGHFSPHRISFERWDWTGVKYVKHELGVTESKYDMLNTTMDEILSAEPDVLTTREGIEKTEKTFSGRGYTVEYLSGFSIESVDNTDIVISDDGVKVAVITTGESTNSEDVREYAQSLGLGMIEFVAVGDHEAIRYLNDVPQVPMEAYTFVNRGGVYHVYNQAAGDERLSKVFAEILASINFLPDWDT